MAPNYVDIRLQVGIGVALAADTASSAFIWIMKILRTHGGAGCEPEELTFGMQAGRNDESSDGGSIFSNAASGMTRRIITSVWRII